MSLKKQIIKNYIKMQLLNNEPGKLHLKMANLASLNKDYVEFAPYVYEAIKMLKGVDDIQVDFNTGEVIVLYSDRLKPEQIIRWINVIIDTAIDYMDFIASNWNSDQNLVIEKINHTLTQKLQKMR